MTTTNQRPNPERRRAVSDGDSDHVRYMANLQAKLWALRALKLSIGLGVPLVIIMRAEQIAAWLAGVP
jgi:hypothetical protein